MANAHETIRVGIIGCGKVAEQRHLPVITNLPGLRLVALADDDADRLDACASRCAVERRFTNYEDLIDCTDIDAVGILTPTASHAKIGLAAIDARKHVIIEKPLALNLAECDQLIGRGASSSNKILVGLNLRWHRLLRHARGLIRRGDIGRVKAIRSVFTHYRTGDDAPDWHKKRAVGGGVIFNEAVHHFDLWRYLLETDVDQVFSFSVGSPGYEDETVVTNAYLSNGALATSVFSLKTSPNNEIEIYGEKGRLHICLYRFDGIARFGHDEYPGSITNRLKTSIAPMIAPSGAIAAMRRGGDFAATFYGMWRHFADCIRSDEVPECGLEDGKRALTISLGALESAISGQPVHIAR